MIEMIIVIGIIGVLAGVLLSKFGGATDSARASQCLTNLRNLATAAHSCAMRSNGDFPAASSMQYRTLDAASQKLGKAKRIGWISGSEKSPAAKFQAVYFDETDDTTLEFAITNGVNGYAEHGLMWKAVGCSRQVYQCPIHAAACRKANGGRNPGWSYVMNRWFGAADMETEAWYALRMNGIRFKVNETDGDKDRPADKVLMFAEIQGLDIPSLNITAETGKDKQMADAVLDDRKESIGFNHKSGRRYTAHVAFADGHVEKLMNPLNDDRQKLTKYLCRGHSINFDGRNYTTEQSSENW